VQIPSAERNTVDRNFSSAAQTPPLVRQLH